MGTPITRSARWMNLVPSSASRTAAVASTRRFLTLRMRAMARKRRNASSERSTLSSPRHFVEAIDLPSPASTFSLKIGSAARTAPS
jgi:hypothetical protein